MDDEYPVSDTGNGSSIGKIFLVLFIMIILLAVGITMIVFGKKYIDENEKETTKYKGGIALLVFGSLFILVGFLTAFIGSMGM